MIYVEPNAMGWRPLTTSWLNRLPGTLADNGGREVLESLMDWLFDPSLNFIRLQCRQMIPVSEMCRVQSTLRFLEALIFGLASEEGSTDNRYLKMWSHASLLFSVIWGIGGCLDADGRTKFDDFIRVILGGKNADLPVPQTIGGRCDFQMPENGLVFEYYWEASFSNL